MLKKLGLPLLFVPAMLMVVGTAPASAGVHIGVYLGGPSYVAPPPVYYEPDYGPPRYYAPAPVYGYGYVRPRFYDRRDEDYGRRREYREREGRERDYREHEWRERGNRR